MAPLASFGFGAQAGLLLLLYVGDTCALFNGNAVSSSSDVPSVTGSLFTAPGDDEAVTCTSGDEGVVPFCTVALISPGVVLTAAHCVQQQITAGNPQAFADLRVSLVRRTRHDPQNCKTVTRETRNNPQSPKSRTAKPATARLRMQPWL